MKWVVDRLSGTWVLRELKVDPIYEYCAQNREQNMKHDTGPYLPSHGPYLPGYFDESKKRIIS